MHRMRLSPLILSCLLLLAAAVPAQAPRYTDYTWAKGLYAEYGFEDLAAAIFTDMAKGPGRSLTEQLQGKLGLAELKQSLARQATTWSERQTLYSDADKLMSEAIKAWPEQTSNEYVQALFTQVGLLQEFGETAMAAARSGSLSDEEVKAAGKDASGAFAKALTSMSGLRNRMGEPDPVEDRERWRLRNRAWYELCYVTYSEALTHEKGKSAYFFGLDRAREELEGFILANETDDEEALLGALYGYLLLAKVQAAKGENTDAEASMTGVIDFVRWDEATEKLHPLIQSLVERTYQQLLSFLNDIQRYDRSLQYGRQFLERFEKRRMPFKYYGHLALVALAEAEMRAGDASRALALASRVVEEAGTNPAGRAANRLVAEIIASVPDRTRFSPDILYAAARGAYSGGEEKLEEAIEYYQLVILTLGAIKSDELRQFRAADAWYSMGRALRTLGRNLEAGFAFGRGFTGGGAQITTNNLSVELGKYWVDSLQKAAVETRSDEIQALARAAQKDVLKYEGILPRGEILYKEASALERDAKALVTTNPEGAIAKYADAAKKFAESAEAGGSRREQALMRAAQTGLSVGELHIKNKDMARAKPLLEKAVQEFKGYLKYSDDPNNALNDAESLARRTDARAIARWSIAKSLTLLRPSKDSKNPAELAERKRLVEETIAVTRGFENDVEGQTSLKLRVVFDRQGDNLELGRIEDAANDLAVLKALDPKHSYTSRAALDLGKAMRSPAEDQWKELVKDVEPTDAEWATVMAKPNAPELVENLSRAYQLYREWLLATAEERSFTDWNFVALRFFSIGKLDDALDLMQRMMDQFGNNSSIAADEIVPLQRRVLIASVELAIEAEGAGDNAKAGSLWSAAGRMADLLIASNHKLAAVASTKRAAAIAYGGYLTDERGRPEYRPALGQFEKAKTIWKELQARLANDPTDAFWEARFYHYYNVWKALAPGESTSRIVASLESLKVSRGAGWGGKNWRSRFEWLLSEMR